MKIKSSELIGPAVNIGLKPYDAGLLNDFGGGDVEWWQDYIRAELGHAHDFYQSQIAAPQPAQATQAEVAEGIRPEDFTVDVVVKPMGGFAQINTKGVRVTHKPTGISVTCDVARSQHANRQQAFEKLSAILATPTAQAHPAEVTDEREAFESCTLMEGSLFKRRADDPDKYWDGNVQDDWELWQAALRPERVPMSMGKAVMYGTHLYAGIMKGEVREVKNSVLIEFSSRQDWGAFLRWHDGITAQAKKETP